ncbi:nicotinamide/nicotinic acid mononucleotide adenylyltransferase, partial [Quercus suber]
LHGAACSKGDGIEVKRSLDELARDALNAEGYCVIGGYMSPVNDAYKKRLSPSCLHKVIYPYLSVAKYQYSVTKYVGLLSAEHRIQLCHLASKSSKFAMVDPWELARDALNAEGYCVIGGYMSPVNDAYKKRGLLSAEHRIQLCHLASKSSKFAMVDPWEVNYSCSLKFIVFSFFWVQFSANACLNSTLFHFYIN